jgi:glycosyltransferase involved in cell wall biosynthesis
LIEIADKKLNSNIIIVLATFNGAEFLRDQLGSLIAQTEAHWSLLIRDDGSTDGTLEIIQDYSQKDERVHLLSDSLGLAGSALGNFSILLEAALTRGAEYVFCCDQDDVWEPNKVELVLARLKQLEGKGGAPSLVHHDLTVVNDSLEPIADSFAALMKLQPGDQQNPQRLISRNEVTGCAMACNRALLLLALPVSDLAVMHDWWLGLCAGFFGRLAYMPQRLVKYRQHARNTIGAKSFWHGLNPFTNWIQGWHRGNDEFVSTVEQARVFRDVIVERLGENSENCATLDLYIKLLSASRWQRLRTLRQCGLWRSHLLLNIILIMRMLLLPRAPG